MSALAGRWNFDGRPGAGPACALMLAAQHIYGPDARAQWDGGAIAMGRNLYRTLPEDRLDRQPLSGGGGRWTLVADVRLDNRADLAAALGIDPAEAAAMADAGLLLAAWEKWQDQVFTHLLGDYAFAVWDERDRRLVLARDALGSRPLHYHVGAGFIAFASMPKGLHALADIPYAPDEARMAEHLVLLPDDGRRSFFAGIGRVEGGHFAAVAPDGVRAVRHWDPRRTAPAAGSADDQAEGLRAHLDRAVRARLRGAEGRVGAHLSGGWDSAAVAATAARLLAPDGALSAFTAVPRPGYDLPVPRGRIADEGPLAAATASLYPNMDHVLVPPDGSGLLDDWDRNFYLFERPLLNACNQMWLTAINKAAQARGITVMLNGQMGNMSLSYAGTEYLAELASGGRWLRLLREGRALVAARRYRWSGVLAAAFGPWMPPALWRALGRWADRDVPALEAYSAISPDRLAGLDLAGRAAARGLDPDYRPRKDGFEARLWVLRRTDGGNFNKGILAGWGLDMRDPTADRALIDYCLALPSGAFLAGGVPRALGHRALADRLPAAVLDARGKGLQAADWHEALVAARPGLDQELARLDDVPAAAGALDLARLRRLARDMPDGGWHRADTGHAYRLALLRGAAAGHFLRKASRTNA